MRSDISEHKLTKNSLAAMREKELAEKYSVSRDTARRCAGGGFVGICRKLKSDKRHLATRNQQA